MTRPALTQLKLEPFVGGQFGSSSADRIRIVDPWNGEDFCEVQTASRDDVSAATAAARQSFDQGEWRKRAPTDRGAVMHAIASGLSARRQELACIEAINSGKPIEAALREVDGAVRVFTYYAGAMDKFFGATIPVGDDLLTFTLREPLGVVAQIVPWNFPLLGASWKLAPAIAAGCSSILKPHPQHH